MVSVICHIVVQGPNFTHAKLQRTVMAQYFLVKVWREVVMVMEGHSQMVTEGHISKFHLGAYYTYFKHQLLVLINVINYNSKILEHLLLLLGILLQLYSCSCHIKLLKLSVDFVFAICEKVPIHCLKSQNLRVNESKTLYSYVKLQIFVRSTINCCLKYIFFYS